MHQSMQSGSIARAPSTAPMSATSNPNRPRISATSPFRPVVVAADEHRGPRAAEIWIDHQRVPHATEGLHEVSVGSEPLEPFHQRVVLSREILQDAVHRRSVRDRVGGVDDRLAAEV